MAIENGVQNAELGYILDPAFQIENLNGKPVVGGYICIYEAGTDNKYISYENFDGAQNPFKIPLRADGRAVILGDPSLTYDIYFYDSYGNQLFSRLNVQCNVPGNISIKGADTRIKNTDGTLDISLQTMGNNVREYTVNTRNKLLDVQSPLYFVENSNTATVIGFDQSGNYVQKDYLADFVTSSISGKADTTAVNDEFTNVHNDITAISSTVSSLPTFSDVESGDDAVKSWVTNQDYATRNEVSAYTKRTDFDAAVESINSNKLDVSAYRAQSGDFLQSADLADYYKKTETSSRNELTAAFDNKLDKSESANYYPMTGNPSGFLTEHQSLAALMSASKLEYTLGGKISGYDGSAFAGGEGGSYTEGDYIDIDGDIISVTGLQPSGDYLSATESANYYPMTGNPSGFLTEHQSLDGYLQNTDLTIVDNKITEISGVPLSAGDELPEGLMNTSALEYNAVNEISGYNGSAIAQYGAEKQWLVHDDTLVHVANSAQYALGVNLSAIAQLLGVDETLLWSGNFNSSGNIILSGSINDYKKVEVYFSNDNGDVTHYVQTIWPGSTRYNILVPAGDGNCWYQNRIVSANAEGTILAVIRSKNFNIGNYTTTATALTSNNTFGDAATFRKIIGIGRKQS